MCVCGQLADDLDIPTFSAEQGGAACGGGAPVCHVVPGQPRKKCNEELLELLRERLDVAAQSLADTKGPWRVWCHSAS